MPVNKNMEKKDPKLQADRIVEIAKRYVADCKPMIDRLESWETVSNPEEITILQEWIVRKTLIVLLDGGYNIPEASMAVYLAFLKKNSMQNAVMKVLGY